MPRLHRDIEPGLGGQPIVRFVIDQPGVTAQRTALAGRFQIGFAGDAILIVGQFVAQGAHHFHQHHADIGFQPVGPVGVALAGKIEQGAAKAVEIACPVINRKINPLLRRAVGVGRVAVEVAGAVGFEAEGHVIEVAIQVGVVDAQPVLGKIARRNGGQAEHIAPINHGPNRAGHRHLRQAIAAGGAVNADLLRRNCAKNGGGLGQGIVLKKVDIERGLVGGHKHKIDAGDGVLLNQLL